MNAIQKQVAWARRRLALLEYLRWLPWIWTPIFAVAALAMLVPKIWSLPVQNGIWNLSWLGGACLLGLIGAAAMTYRRRPTILAAATEIDRRFRLKERVSSALLLSDSERGTPVGEALIEDASRRISGIDVPQEFRIHSSPWQLLPLCPVALALFVGLFLQDTQPATASVDPAAVTPPPRSTELLKKQLAERRKELEEKGLKDATKLFSKIEQQLGAQDKKKEDGQKDVMIKLNDVTKMVKERQQEVGDVKELKHRLENLQSIPSGPADRVAKAIREGDFKKAADLMKELQKELAAGKLSAEKRAELQKQLEQMGNSLKELTAKHAENRDALKKEIDKAQQAGDFAKAGMLQDQLDKMAKIDSPMQSTQKMAQQLSDASKQLGQGKTGEASKQLGEMGKQLEQMAQNESELKSLDEALEQLSECKESMQCSNCQGNGCEQCQGLGNIGMAGDGKGKGDGDGLGEGEGRGDRPESQGDVNSYDSQVRGKLGKGKAVRVGTADGANIAGPVLEEIREAVEAAKVDEDDPLTNVRLPRGHRNHVQQYFDAVREGE